MFILSYINIYFFVKKIIFSKVYISVYTIFEFLYVFFGWKRGHQLSTCEAGRGMGGSSKMRGRGRECHASCVCTHLRTYVRIFFHVCSCFSFFLIGFCFICRNLTLPFFKKDVSVRNGYNSPTRSISVVMKWAFLT